MQRLMEKVMQRAVGTGRLSLAFDDAPGIVDMQRSPDDCSDVLFGHIVDLQMRDRGLYKPNPNAGLVGYSSRLFSIAITSLL